MTANAEGAPARNAASRPSVRAFEVTVYDIIHNNKFIVAVSASSAVDALKWADRNYPHLHGLRALEWL